jgi:hypothetical protein
MLVLLVAAAQISAVEAGSFIDLDCLPCRPTCLVFRLPKALFLKLLLCKLICLGQTIFLDIYGSIQAKNKATNFYFPANKTFISRGQCYKTFSIRDLRIFTLS